MALKPGEVAPVPDPAAPPPVFDPAVFEAGLSTRLMAEFNKGLNGAIANLKKEILKSAPVADPTVVDPPVDPKAIPGLTPEANAEMVAMRKEVAKLTKSNTESESRREIAEKAQAESDRRLAVDSAISEITDWATPKAKQTFVKANYPDMHRDDDGTYYFETPSGKMPARDYLVGEYEDQSGLHAPAGHSGAGASKGVKPGNNGMLKNVTDLTSADIMKMTPAEQNELSAHLSRALQTA